MAHSDHYAFSDADYYLIKEIADQTEAELREIFPQLYDDLHLTIVASTAVIPETGVSAQAVAYNAILFFVDPWRSESVDPLVRLHLRSTLYHELHHLVRGWVIQGSHLTPSLMEAMVSEGMATAFQRDFVGDTPLWGSYPDNVDEWVAELVALPPTAYEEYNDWMFMHPDGRRWIGYRAGTYIVDQAMKASGLSAADLVSVPVEEVLKMAGIAIPDDE